MFEGFWDGRGRELCKSAVQLRENAASLLLSNNAAVRCIETPRRTVR